ncbi:MAG TPA: zinc-ribbon domain-containing protein [Pyrinomonadaceae bacterium]|nr:zinc-ribbon domain-containing protein [Pyrinomonadaceae bacterium]
MNRCQNCGRDVEEGRSACPHCGQPVAAAADVVAGADVNTGAAGRGSAASTSALQTAAGHERGGGFAGAETGSRRDAPTLAFGAPPPTDGDDAGTRRTIFIVVGLVGLLLLGALAYYATRPAPAPGERRLENALRPGSPEFEQIKDRIVVDFAPDEDATIGGNALGNYVVTMNPKVRNFTTRTIDGLEFRAAGLTTQGEVIRELIYVSEREIEPNRVGTPAVGVNFPSDRRPSQLRLELTGVRFK